MTKCLTQISANNSTWYGYSKITRKSGNIWGYYRYRALTRLRFQGFDIRLENKPRVGTLICQNLV